MAWHRTNCTASYSTRLRDSIVVPEFQHDMCHVLKDLTDALSQSRNQLKITKSGRGRLKQKINDDSNLQELQLQVWTILKYRLVIFSTLTELKDVAAVLVLLQHSHNRKTRLLHSLGTGSVACSPLQFWHLLKLAIFDSSF